jgi:hypothetical protein
MDDKVGEGSTSPRIKGSSESELSDRIVSGTEDDREARALLGWVRAVDEATEEGILSRHVVEVDDLCDGVAFFDILGAV